MKDSFRMGKFEASEQIKHTDRKEGEAVEKEGGYWLGIFFMIWGVTEV